MPNIWVYVVVYVYKLIFSYEDMYVYVLWEAGIDLYILSIDT